MLKNLRLRLTLLYLLVAFTLSVLVAGSAYSLLNYYFQTSTDLALKFKMAETFESLGAPLPAELSSAEQTWLSQPGSNRITHNENDNEKEEEDSRESYEGELSDVFILPLDASGKMMINPNPFSPPMAPDIAAATEALKRGSDLRTVTMKDGTPVRLLSYAVPPQFGFDVIQAGKAIGNQVYVLNQLLSGLLVLGLFSILGLGIGSWWLAGRSLAPTQKAWEMQQIFVANASHELRTPLTLIRASSEMALRHTPEGISSARELLGDVIKECDYMTRLVEDLLLLSRLDAKKLDMEHKPVSLAALLSDVSHQFMPLVEKHGVHMVTKQTEVKVLGDDTRLRQVLLILLDNALRHTPQDGTIELSATRAGRWVRVSVADTGRGILPENLPYIFERYYQVKANQSTENHGSGLGLAIAKSLIEAHAGKITATSNPGKGTTISFTLNIFEGDEA